VTAGGRLREALQVEKPVQCVGVINAYHARLAEASGYRALYLSGGGVAAGSCGLPDLGMTNMEDVLIDLRRITDTTDLPILVDIDTGWGGALNIARTVRMMNRTGAAGVHIEDQVSRKRCGHRPNKAIVSRTGMVDRIKAAVDAKHDDGFVVMARTDALAVEGMQSAIDRACACVEAGADMVFPEAMTELEQYRKFVEAVEVPVLANITEFGATPLFTTQQLTEVGVSIALYPLSAFRAASKAALDVYEAIRREGSQQNVLEMMQTREELYDHLEYHEYEKKIDQLNASKQEDNES
jgi:methylisocitrate lyase